MVTDGLDMRGALRSTLRFLLSALVCGCVLASLGTNASARAPDDPWFTDLEMVSDLPLSAGVRMVVEAPHRIRFGLTLGWLPSVYVDLLNGIATGVGAYDQDVADLISVSLEQSLSTRIDLGWRPFPESGFYGLLGYRWLGFSGEVSGLQVSEIIEEAAPEGHRIYTVTSSLHMVETELGWQWFPGADITLRAALGFAATFGASAEVDARYTIEDYEGVATARLTAIYRDYAFTPLINLGVGYRFR